MNTKSIKTITNNLLFYKLSQFNFSKSTFKMIRKPDKSLFPIHEHKDLFCSNQFRKGTIIISYNIKLNNI